MELAYQKLEQNLIDLIKEEQIKLGYQKETIRLYYPADSLLRLLGKELSIEELQQELEWFGAHTEYLGTVTVSHKKTASASVFRRKGQSMYMNGRRRIRF